MLGAFVAGYRLAIQKCSNKTAIQNGKILLDYRALHEFSSKNPLPVYAAHYPVIIQGWFTRVARFRIKPFVYYGFSVIYPDGSN